MRNASGPFSEFEPAESFRSLGWLSAKASQARSEVTAARAMLRKTVMESAAAMADADDAMGPWRGVRRGR